MPRPIVAILLAVAAITLSVTPRTVGAQRRPVTPRTPVAPVKPGTPPASESSLRILLVDDDWSDNNNNPSDSRRSPSDLAFRRLVSDAVGRDTGAMAIDVVRLYANGPDIDRLRQFSLVIWYTGASYGGNADNAAVLSITDEKTVRRYLEETGGTVILVSPGYVSKVLGANSTWEKATWPFLNEVLGIKGGKGLAQRFQPGTVMTPDGAKFTVGKGNATVETQFSAVNPEGATVVFTSALATRDIGDQPAPVATVSSFGRGRIVYVGFTFENLDAAELAPAFRVLLAAGRPAAATVAATEPTMPVQREVAAEPTMPVQREVVVQPRPIPTVRIAPMQPLEPSPSSAPPPPAPAPAPPPPPPPAPAPAPPRNPPPPPPPSSQLLVGTGVSDITGPVAEVVMQGYARMAQVASGLNQRLYARAYVFANANGPRVVFVSAELGQLFGGVKQGVLRKLSAQYGGLYTDRNLMLSATHTHAGPGGYAHFALYNFTSFGYVQQNYDAIVDGITAAIVIAHNSLAPATVRIGTGPVNFSSINRSEVAFNANRDAAGRPSMSRDMTLLRIDRASGPAGVISWFDVHNTSLTRMNTLVSSDHKGYASYLFEAEKGTIQPIQAPNGFVAAFANGAFGDQSPNINFNFTGPGGDDYFKSMRMIGEREYDAAAAIFGGPLASVRGKVDFRHSFVAMTGLLVATTERNGIGTTTLCRGAYGASFATGSEDGRSGEPGFVEGMRFEQRDAAGWRNVAGVFRSVLMPQFLTGAFNTTSSMFNDACQLPKPILIPGGALGWTPDILPFQLLRVGNVVIAGIPGEMTIQAGRRLHGALLSSLRNVGVTHVILTGLANEYSGYITTAEEYDTQQYEGASTLFGRLTFDAYLQLFGKLAGEMIAGVPSAPGPTPSDLSRSQASFQTGVVYDDKRIWETFGQVLTEPPETVSLGSTVTVTFRAGHPKNKLNTGWSYYFIERLTPSGIWASQVWDSMPEGTFTWRRDTAVDCLACSFVDVTWNVPLTARPGTYHIMHNGAWKNGFTGALTAYAGTTRTFQVR